MFKMSASPKSGPRQDKMIPVFYVLMTLFALVCGEARATEPFNLAYTGRLVDESGKPMAGPLDLQISFYDGDGKPKAYPYFFYKVALKDGVFKVTLDIKGIDSNDLFGGATQVEVTDMTNNKIYPKQRFAAVPFAMRVPVDGKTIGFNTGGQLSIENSAVSGGQIIATINQSTDKINSARLPDLSGDVTGEPGANTITKIQGKAVSANTPSANDVLQWNGTAWTPSQVTGAGGGSVTSISASAPLGVANGSSTPVINITQSGSTTDGYLAASDWNTFNSKQNALTAANSIAGGFLTSADWVTFNGKQENLGYTPINKVGDTMSGALSFSASNGYVGVKAPSSVVASTVFTLPAADGTSGQFLSTDGSGILSWISQSAALVSSVAGKTGAVSLSTSDLTEGTNLYYTDARVKSVLNASGPLTYSNGTFGINQANGGVGGYLSSGDWSAFNGKQSALSAATSGSSGWLSSSDWLAFNSKESSITSGTTSQYLRGDKSWQTLSTTDVAEGSLLYYTDSRARAAISGSGVISYDNGSGVIGLAQADGSNHGYLASTDWTTFNGKQAALSFTPVNKAGDTMGGALHMGGYDLSSVGNIGLGAAKTLALGSYATDPGGLTASDKGKTWFNSTSGEVKYWNGSAAIALGAAGSGLANLNGEVGNSQTFANGSIGTAPTFNSASNVHTLNIPMASGSGVTAGLISKSDYDTFNAKQPALDAATGSSNGYLASSDWVSFNSKGGVASVTAGAGLSGGTITTNGTIALSTSGVTAGTYVRANVTVDSYGRIISAANSALLVNGDIDSNASIDQEKIAGLTASLAGKEQAIATGSAGQYLSGNKSWQNLNTAAVAESGSLYYTDARARAALGGSGVLAYDSSTGVFSLAQANGSTDGYLSSSDWTSFNSISGKVSSVTGTAPVTVTGTTAPIVSMAVATSGADGYLASSDWSNFNGKQPNLGYTPLNKAGDTMSGPILLGSPNDLRFGAASGTNYVSLKAPATVSTSVTWTLPATDGASGQILATNGSGSLSWTSGAPGSVSSVSGSSPVNVTGGTTPVVSMSQAAGTTDGYLSSADWTSFNGRIGSFNTLTAATQTLAIGTTGTAPTWNSATSTHTLNIPMSSAANVTAGLLSSADWSTFNGKQAALSGATSVTNGYLASSDWIAFNSKEGAISSGTSAQFWRGDKTWHTLDTSAVSEGSNQYYLDARARSAISAVVPLVYSDATGIVSLPKATSSADGYISSGDWSTFNTGASQWSASNGNIYRSSGNVGIGTTAPVASLDINGAIKATAVSNASTAIDFSTGNLQYTSSSCTGMTLKNMKSGGTYALSVQGNGGGTCAFTAYSDGGSTSLTVKTGPAALTQTSNKMTIFSFMVMGSVVFVTAVDGY